MARRAVDDIDGALFPVRFVLHDRDSKFCASFPDTLRSAGVQPLSLPVRSPNLNAFAERWQRPLLRLFCWELESMLHRTLILLGSNTTEPALFFGS